MQELLKALVKAKLEIQAPKKSKFNNFTKSYYATYDDICASVNGPLAKNGLSIDHDIFMEGERFWMGTHLRHISGEVLVSKIPLFPSKNDNQSQAFAAGITYAKRYSVCCLLSLGADEDDDGESAGPQKNEENKVIAVVGESAQEELIKKKKPIIAQIEKNLNSNLDDLSKILKEYGTSNLWDLTVATLSKINNQTQMRKR